MTVPQLAQLDMSMLSPNSFLAQLTGSELDSLARRWIVRRYLAGPVGLSGVVILLRGLLAVRMNDSAAEHEGVSVTLHGPGDALGLTGAILGHKSDLVMADILGPGVEVAVLTRESFLQFADSRAGMLATRQDLARRHQAMVNEKSRMSLPTDERLRLLLYDLMKRFGHQLPDGGVMLGVPLSQSLIADVISASRTGVEKAFAGLRRQDLVRTGYRSLILTRRFVTWSQATAGRPESG